MIALINTIVDVLDTVTAPISPPMFLVGFGGFFIWYNHRHHGRTSNR